MIYKDGETGHDFECYLVDDGTMDTVISIEGQEFRFDSEYASEYRDDDGAMTTDGFFALVEITLDDCWDMIVHDQN